MKTYNMVYGKVSNFIPSRTLATFGDFGGVDLSFMQPEIPAGAIALPPTISGQWWRGDSGGKKKYKNNFQRHFENLRSMGAVPDNLKGDNGGFLRQHTRPYRLPPAYTQNERIKKLLGTEFGDNGGTFSRVSHTPFSGPRRYTLQ